MYDIKLSNIITITIDNGKNLIKTAKNLNEEVINEEDEDSLMDENYEDNILNNINNNIELKHIETIYCAAHCLQIGINNFLKFVILDFDSVRKIVSTLRTTQYNKILEAKKIPVPSLHNLTRWNSFYLMIKSFLTCRDIIENNPKREKHFNVTIEECSKYNQLSEILELAYKFTLYIQKQEITFSDFFIKYKMLISDLEDKKQNMFSTLLIFNIKDKCDKLIDNPLMKAAVFLDSKSSDNIIFG